MSQKVIVKLKFKSPLHIGSDIPGVGKEAVQPIAHSDTIFSCLINTFALLDKNGAESLLDEFNRGNPPFKLSSAFLFNDTGYFLPKPFLEVPDFLESPHGLKRRRKYSKEVKETEFVRLSTFTKWVNGENISPDRLESERDDYQKAYSIEVRPQHTRDRLTNMASIYHIGLVHFRRVAGLYFILEIPENSSISLSLIKNILKYAGEKMGLGGRRTLGNGLFDCDYEERLNDEWRTLLDNNNTDGYTILSLYAPKDKERLSEPLSYEVVRRKGWNFSSTSFKKMKINVCTMFSEGSVFKEKPEGILENVTPRGFDDHQIYRYGIPITVPVKLLEGNNE